jgi:hypothetical protein
MENKIYLFRSLVVYILLGLILIGCSSQFSTDPGVPVTITPTLNGKALPEGIDSIELNVTGPGMEQIEESIEIGENSVTIEVPSGEEREFNIDVTTSLVTFSGSAVEDLTAGEETEITIPMDLSEIKMLIPDAMNGRIVKLDDMDGSGWITTNFGYSDFAPWDIDFDSQGTVYLATSPAVAAPLIFRIGLLDEIPTVFHSGSLGFRSIAVDRINDIVYFAESNALFRSNLDLTEVEPIETDIGVGAPIQGISGLEVLDNGHLLIASNERIDIYDTSGSGQIIESDSVNYVNDIPSDFLYKNGFAYLSCSGGSSSGKIVRFDMRSTYSFNDPIEYNTNLAGPKRFIRTLSDKIIFIDENQMIGEHRIISIGDISGTEREQYGSQGSAGDGPGKFEFFEMGMVD